MSEKLKTIFFIFLLLLLLPYLITYALQGETLFSLEQTADTDAEKEDSEPTEVLTGILAEQIRMDAPSAAIYAQAVLVRTEYVRRQQSGEEQESALSLDELTALWGSDKMKEYYGVAQRAVLDTAGEILTYEGQPIQTAYHKVSAGSTRAVAEWNGVETPYLTSVSCGMDITSPDYLSVRFFSADEVQTRLALDAQMDASQLFSAISLETDEAGYVTAVNIGEKTFSGDEFRQMLGLPSPCFYLKEVDGRLRVVGKGKGHGIGMSQYAAQQQAESGASYEEILTYFFPATKIAVLTDA